MLPDFFDARSALVSYFKLKFLFEKRELDQTVQVHIKQMCTVGRLWVFKDLCGLRSPHLRAQSPRRTVVKLNKDGSPIQAENNPSAPIALSIWDICLTRGKV